MGSITHKHITVIPDDPTYDIMGTDWNDTHDFTLSKSDVGLTNVDNTSDVDKPVSTATGIALSAKSEIVIGETSADAYRGDRGKTAYDHSQVAHAPSTAEQNVNSDWIASSGDAQILNKPTIPDTLPCFLSDGTSDPILLTGGASTNKVYRVILLFANSTENTIATVTGFENTLGDIVWTKTADDGYVTGVLTGAFPVGKVWCQVSNADGTYPNYTRHLNRYSDNRMDLYFSDAIGTVENDSMVNSPINILIIVKT
jgi:hypothetical protein